MDKENVCADLVEYHLFGFFFKASLLLETAWIKLVGIMNAKGNKLGTDRQTLYYHTYM